MFSSWFSPPLQQSIKSTYKQKRYKRNTRTEEFKKNKNDYL